MNVCKHVNPYKLQMHLFRILLVCRTRGQELSSQSAYEASDKDGPQSVIEFDEPKSWRRRHCVYAQERRGALPVGEVFGSPSA